MKLRITFLSVVLIAGVLSAKAQHAKVKDDELVRYAIATDSLKKLTDQFSQRSLKFSNDPKITAARQQQLARAQDDSLKLVAMNATAYEKAYLKKLREQRSKETEKFKSSYSALINDYVGSDVYTKVSTELKKDSKLKHKYDSITATLQKKP